MVAFAEEVVLFAADSEAFTEALVVLTAEAAVAFVAEEVVAAPARSALLNAGVHTLAADVSLAEPAAPSLTCAKE